MALVSAAPYLALLNEDDESLKSYALTSLNGVVDQLWAEIANNITDLEELYEDEDFANRKLAALIISKVYYNLGDFEASAKYSLAAGDEFNIEEQSQYIETVVSQCINLYTVLSQQHFDDATVVIDDQLAEIFEKLLNKCFDAKDYKLALGIALDSFRLDIVEKTLRLQLDINLDTGLQLITYVMSCTNTIIHHEAFKAKVLNSLIDISLSLKSNPDFFTIFKIIIQLNDSKLASGIFKKLIAQNDKLIACQGAFDLVSSSSQELLDNIINDLKQDPEFQNDGDTESKVLFILSGVPTSDLEITFLYKNNNTDISILNRTKNSLEGRSSIFHSAVTFANAFIHAGTTDDSFLRKNLEWLGKATNWSKFSATAALGVIHKGNLFHGRNILKPYLPGSSGSCHTKGGSLFALGLIFAGHGGETIDYLKKLLDENGNSAGNNETDVMLHGACLGAGVAAMATNNESLFEALKVVLYSDSAIAGQTAGLAMGLVMLGSGNKQAITDMISYAEETQHEKIIRGLALGVALLNFGQGSKSDEYIDTLLAKENSILRYGGVLTIALAYAGTGDNEAIKKLLHFAVSDPIDDVRRAAVLYLGFVLIRDYTSTPQIVKLLSQSHNPHVRYGSAMALGISCAGKLVPSAIEVLEPLTKDPVDFVRQGAFMATAMILIQQNEVVYPKVKDFRERLFDTISNKHEDALAKFGATLAQGILDAGGRNVTINLENPQSNTLNRQAIVGLAVFLQSWYWFPMAHFLALSFVPTAIIGVRELDLKVPKFEINCHSKPKFFEYPPKVEETKEKQPDKLATAVLSITAKAKARAKKNQAKKDEEDGMNVDTNDDKAEENVEKTEENVEKGEEEKPDSGDHGDKAVDDKEKDKDDVVRYSKVAYKIENMSRVLPGQMSYVSFIKDQRFVPVRRPRGVGGIIVLEDTKPDEPFKMIKTIRFPKPTEAPVPVPFVLSDEDVNDTEGS